MKRHVNYVLAGLVFVVTMVLLYGSSVLLSSAAAVIGFFLQGGMLNEGIYHYLLNNQNLFSCMIYLVLAVVFCMWFYFAFVEKQGTASFAAEQTKRLSPAAFGWLVILAFTVEHVITLLISVIGMLMPSAMQYYNTLVETSGVLHYSVLWAIATLIFPPIVEETIFRGLIYRYLRRGGAGFIAANLIQAVLFGVFHMNLIQGIYAACLGFLLGYLVYRYDSLIMPMAMHALFNLFGTLITEVEGRLLPDLMFGGLIFACVPITAVVLVMMHYGVGEKRN